METKQNKKEKRSFLSSNPVMRRLDSVDETSDSACASYGGITLKTIYFLLFSVVGVFVQLLMQNALATGGTFKVNYESFKVDIFYGEAIALVVAVVLAIAFQIMAFFARKTTPITGALYSITQGYIISFLIFTILGAYDMEYLGALALLITMLIVVIMAVLYSTGIIRVTQKFKLVLTVLFFTVVAVSLFTLIGYFIPFTRGMVTDIRQNFGFSVGFGIIFIIIASLFLICDFDTIDHVVNDKLPKKYEWQAAFGLSFTVLWLYLKVLDLIITIAGHSKD
ncbi:MAG: Bax inhibitor-1/YccA family protein [Ruminococcus sp.]|nr:Bax inhibitor-1/YccA family protein [Ruminococcus sp.]